MELGRNCLERMEGLRKHIRKLINYRKSEMAIRWNN